VLHQDIAANLKKLVSCGGCNHQQQHFLLARVSCARHPGRTSLLPCNQPATDSATHERHHTLMVVIFCIQPEARVLCCPAGGLRGLSPLPVLWPTWCWQEDARHGPPAGGLWPRCREGDAAYRHAHEHAVSGCRPSSSAPAVTNDVLVTVMTVSDDGHTLLRSGFHAW